MSNKLTSLEKIKKPTDFKKVGRSGKKYSTENLAVNILKKETKKQKETRLGITIPNRVEKSAVRRNKTRRLIREFFRLNKEVFKEGFDYSFYIRKNPFNSYREIEGELKTLLKKTVRVS